MSIHKIMKKSGIRYKAVVQLTPVKQVCRVFVRKIDAERWENEQKSLARTTPLSAEKEMTVAELARYWSENYAVHHKAASSVLIDERFSRGHILPAFGMRRIQDLTPLEVERWMNRLRAESGLAPKTCNHCLGLLRKMLNDAVRWQFLRFNPITAVKPFKIEQQDFAFWTREEAVAFMAYVSVEDPAAFPVFAVALYTGLCKGEMRGLKWDCVNLEQRQITVKRAFCQYTNQLRETTKSKRIRRVPINQTLYAVLVELKTKRRGEFVLDGFNYHHCYRVMQRLAKVVGVKPIRFHDLRHTFASHFMMGGGTVYDLQRILGHSTIAMTERYTHMSPDHLVGKTEFLNFGNREDTRNVVRLSDFRK